jgi:hypothetical protein
MPITKTDEVGRYCIADFYGLCDHAAKIGTWMSGARAVLSELSPIACTNY